HFQRTLAGFVLRIARVESRQKIQRHRSWKLRCRAEPAFFVIETARKLFVGGLKKSLVDLSSASRLRVLRFAKRFHNLRSLLGNFFVVLFPSGGNPLENFSKSRLTVAIFRRKISSADKRFQIRRKPDTHRPTAAAGR